MLHVLYTATKALHILLAVMWLGGALFNLLVVQRALREATPSTRREVTGRIFPAMSRYFNLVGGLTLLSGALLLYLHPHGTAGLTRDLFGKLIVFGAVATVAVLYLAATSIRATWKGIQKALATLPPGEEVPGNVRFLLLRLQVTNGLMVALLLVVFITMVWANQAYWGPR